MSPTVIPHKFAPGRPATESLFRNVVRDADGRVKHDSIHHNLRTNAGGTWQATQMGATTGQTVGAYFVALTTDATAAAYTDTTVASELATSGFSRAAGTFTFVSAASGAGSYTITKTFTATGTATINKEGLLTAASAGTLVFESNLTSPPTLNSGDSLAITVTVNY